MRLLPVLFIFISIEAKHRRLKNEKVNRNGQKNIDQVDVYPERFGAAVDFGHVYRNDEKQQIPDELDMINPTSIEHARQLLRKIGSDIVSLKKPEEPMGFANPRDAIQYRIKSGKANIGGNNTLNRPLRVKNVTQTMRKSVKEKVNKKLLDHWSKIKEHPPEEFFSNNEESRRGNLFSKSSFNLVSDEPRRTRNWTTCKEFAKGAVFHPDDVINIPWLPFYIWSTRGFSTSVIHTFTYPTKKTVNQYKDKYNSYLNAKIDWEQPKLLLKEDNEMLLIAGDRKGLFYCIQRINLPSPTKKLKITMPVLTIRLKIVDPYLAMMFCNEDFATIMSVLGTEPETKSEKAAEAALLKFHGEGSPAERNLNVEKRKAKFEIERKQKEEASKYVEIERPDNLDPSTF